MEILAVLSIAGVLMLMAASLMQTMGKGESRQASRALVSAAFNRARTQAISKGKSVAVVMIPYEQGPEGKMGKAMTIYEVRKDAGSGNWLPETQLRRWVDLPGRMIFSKGTPVANGGQNAFNQPPVMTVRMRFEGEEGVREVPVLAVIFGETGSVVWPAGSGELELHLQEGTVRTGLVQGGGDINDWSKHEVFLLGRQTGRLRYLKTL